LYTGAHDPDTVIDALHHELRALYARDPGLDLAAFRAWVH
jgi:hypothetical protein